MDLRSQTSLLGAVLSLAVAVMVLLRPRKRRIHWLFVWFALTVGVWYLTAFFARWSKANPFWERLNLGFAVLLPLVASQFFRAFLLADSKGAALLSRISALLAAVMAAAILSPLYSSPLLGASIFVYVFALLGATLALVREAALRAPSRFDRARLNYLAWVGTFAAIFTLAEYLPYTGLDIPPVGTVLILVFLYMLAESILRYRLLDLYELAAKLLGLTALSFALAGILWVLVWLDPGNFYLHSVAAALVLLIVFEPVYGWVEQQIASFFLRERQDIERLATKIRSSLSNATSLSDIIRAVIDPLSESKRVTKGSLYLLDTNQSVFRLVGHVGGKPIDHLEVASARAFFERLQKEGALTIENIEREREERRELKDSDEAIRLEEILATMNELATSLAIAIRSESEVYGLLCLRDERLKDAYTPEEIAVLRTVSARIAASIESLRLYERLRDRDRLAALGEMAAGLAHEIRNPLGAIKASAQFMAESLATEGELNKESLVEFVDIIVEEVDRLNRVVTSFLDYARPSPHVSEARDPSGAIEKTLQLIRSELGSEIELIAEVAQELPPVRIDPERLRQVLFNLLLNAIQAMEGKGRLRVRSLARQIGNESWVEIQVSDTGPGLPDQVKDKLFVPFVTTKEGGTGLGLAISQRIVSAAGGRIEVRPGIDGKGVTFVVLLPAVQSEHAAEVGMERRAQEAQSEAIEPRGAPIGLITER
ncbi:MAG: ATP-binding protein [Deltaproteobacteria bacterium]|nr:ATP-binding protein [Deltaproteobacteria bacterium]